MQDIYGISECYQCNAFVFEGIEMKVLKEEFSHHQDKIDQYYSLLKDAEENDESMSHCMRILHANSIYK